MKVLTLSLLAIASYLIPISKDFSVTPVATSQSAYIKQKEIDAIDNELESLMNLRDYYTSKMTRYRNRAARYEFQGDNLEESKHLYEEADKIEAVIKQIDEEIVRLEKERATLMKS